MSDDQSLPHGLRWEDQSESEDEAGSVCMLKLGRQMIGEAFAWGANFRWKCKTTDWRGLQPTMDEAKAELLAHVIDPRNNALPPGHL